jgi:hypothetical protein
MAGFCAQKGGAVGVHDDLTAESLVLEDERCTIAIVCLDIIYITLQRTQRICRAANRATGITVDNIMISTSYNHSGPDLNTPECEEWSSFSKAKVVDAACEGWFCRQDASIGVGVSSVTGIGVNRRGKSSIDIPKRMLLRLRYCIDLDTIYWMRQAETSC